MNAFYEILFRGRPDGTLSGAHLIPYVGELPGRAQAVGTDALPWSDVTGALNTVALASVKSLTAQVATLEAALAEAATQLETARAEAAAQIAAVQTEAAAQLEAAQAEIARLTPPPQALSISPRQLRLYLLSIGQLGAVETIIAGLDGPEGDAARIEWGFSTAVLRSHHLTEAIGTMLGLSPADLDAAFNAAAAL